MAMNNQFSAVLVLLILCGATLIEAGSIPPPWVGKSLPREPVRGLWKFLRNCRRQLTNECGQRVYDYIFHVRNDIPWGCCKKLVKMGDKCNRGAAYGLSHVPEFARWRGNIYERSYEAYKFCQKKLTTPHQRKPRGLHH